MRRRKRRPSHPGFSKRRAQRLHASRRMMERHDLWFGPEGQALIVTKIQKGDCEFIEKQSNRVSVFDVEYLEKVYRAVMDTFKGKPCAVCGTTYGTCGHHIIPKGSCPHHYATPDMIIPLCNDHHIWAHGGRLHSSNPFIVGKWMDWLEANYPERYAWAKEHQHDTAAKCGKIDWQARYEELIDSKG